MIKMLVLNEWPVLLLHRIFPMFGQLLVKNVRFREKRKTANLHSNGTDIRCAYNLFG